MILDEMVDLLADVEDYDDPNDEKKGDKEGHDELPYDVPIYLLQSVAHTPKVLN
jgi:hypothetical protein